MEKLAVKKQLFEKAIQQQQTLVNDIQKRLSDLKESITSLEVGSFGEVTMREEKKTLRIFSKKNPFS
jgi:hypothetical protein